MVKEVNDLAGQHEVIVESLSNNVLKDLQTSIVETKQERKRVGFNCKYFLFACRCVARQHFNIAYVLLLSTK